MINCSGSRGRQGDGKYASYPRRAFDLQPPLMTVDDVLNDGEAQARPATFAASLHVNPVKALSQSGDRFARYPLPFILHRDENLVRALASGRGVGTAETHPDLAPFAAIFDGVVD